MPLDTSPIPDYVADRGPTKYFHGRVRILANFDKLVKDSMEPGGGSTFLIQGAPGVGKTALLYECEKLAKGNGWEVSKISIEDLYTPASMSQSLGKSYTVDHEQAAKVGVKFIEGGYVRSVAGHASPKEILKSLAPKEGLILMLDEAQRLTNLEPPSTEKILAMSTLDVIHNGDVGHPVILLAAGLGTTIEAFGDLGISRFKEGCVVELGALSKESERAVIQDWLVKEGGAKGDPAPWIHAIAQKTHGWPRHVHSYARHAAKHLKEKGGLMTPQGLKIIMELGEEGRKQYYKQRVSKFRGDQLQCLMKSMGEADKGKTARYKVIMSSMVDEYGREEAKNLFDLFIEKGILEEHEEGYAISIPSMHTWLNEKYGLERTEPTRERKARPTPPKDFGMER